MTRGTLSAEALSLPRRRFLQAAGLSMAGISASGWLPALARQVATAPSRRGQCILLWMAGGPSQLDTFDMKPGHEHGGEFREGASNVTGMRFSELLPQLRGQADKMAIVRGLSTKEGDHGRGTYLVRTGRSPGGGVHYPAIGSAISKELGSPQADLPNYISILPFTAVNPAAFMPGFLGPAHAAMMVGEIDFYGADQRREAPVAPAGFAELGVDHLRLPAGVDARRQGRRLGFWSAMQKEFLATHQTAAAVAQHIVYERAASMMESPAIEAFDLSRETAKVREAYGRSRFGQGCLMARRLIERGVPCVEVTLGDLNSSDDHWDTHQDNFRHVRRLAAQLDAGWAMLMRDLDERGLLESTTILWIGEFGRTPKINENAGRDHYPQAWSCVICGGGVRGGQVYGRTSDDGTEVIDGKVSVSDVLATLCMALGVDPAAENSTSTGRPIKIVEGQPILGLLA